MRLLGMPLGLLLAACSTDLADQPKPETINAPDPVKVAGTLKSVASQAKLQPPFEVSAPIEAPSNNIDRWMICLRSAASGESKRLTYSLFFKNDDLKSWRLSAIIEPCGAQVYTELK